VNEKGYIVIPAKVRRKFGITHGTRIWLDVDDATRRIILTPITSEYIMGRLGKYKGKGLLKALAAMKHHER
jgi:AbrB family looped-hinge helix DNA binding protein